MRKAVVAVLIITIAWLSSALIQAAEADALSSLIEDLLSSNFVVSTKASDELAGMGTEVIPRIAEDVLTDPAWANRFKGITVLKNMGAVEGIPHLMHLLDDEQQRVRTYARELLMGLLPPAVKPPNRFLLNYWWQRRRLCAVRRKSF